VYIRGVVVRTVGVGVVNVVVVVVLFAAKTYTNYVFCISQGSVATVGKINVKWAKL